MIPLVIDYHNIIIKYSSYLPKLISKVSSCGNPKKALVLGMKDTVFKQFDSQSSGLPKIKYMNTEKFLKGIDAYGFYSTTYKVCGRKKEQLEAYIKLKLRDVKFSKDTISQWKAMTRKKKEISGKLCINRNVIKLDKYKVGKKEKADIVKSRYSYHTHTEDAYKRHEVNVGWPSGDDYLAFLESVEKHNTLFHCIITLEGIYIISMKENIFISPKTYKEAKKYDIPYPDIAKDRIKIIRNYIKKVNKGIFNVKFVPWKDSHRPLHLEV